jgi:hypothetical protein
VHIRVWGEGGIGKTRLVLEATRARELAPEVRLEPTTKRLIRLRRTHSTI